MIGLVLAAAGAGSRFGAETPKQFLQLRGLPVYQHSLRRFSALCAEMVVVVPEDRVSSTAESVRELEIGCPTRVIAGGKHRQESVWKGLRALRSEIEVVLVHDAARPFVSEELIRRVIEGTLEFSACIPAIPVGETVKEVTPGGHVGRTVDRSSLCLAQTPQGFRRDILESAFENAAAENFFGTDEASLVERLGVPVRVVDGEPVNLKITWPDDLPGPSSLSVESEK